MHGHETLITWGIVASLVICGNAALVINQLRASRRGERQQALMRRLAADWERRETEKKRAAPDNTGTAHFQTKKELLSGRNGRSPRGEHRSQCH